MLIDIKSMNTDELTKLVTDSGFPKFRASQIRDWLCKGVSDFDEIKQ